MNSENGWLPSCQESARRGENLRPDGLEFTFSEKPDRYTIIQLRIQSGQPSLHNVGMLVVTQSLYNPESET